MIVMGILVLLALVHFYWAMGGRYGLEQALPTNKEGHRVLNPSRFMTYMVGFVLLGFAYVAYMLYIGEPSIGIKSVGWGLSLLFLLRVVGDFKMVGIFKKIQNTVFARYDNWVFIPLCLFISLGYLDMLVQ